MTTYYVDAKGNSLGGFDGVMPPVGSIQVDVIPEHGSQRWDGQKWNDTDASKAARLESDMNLRGVTLKAQVAALWQKATDGISDKADALKVIEDQVINDSKP